MSSSEVDRNTERRISIENQNSDLVNLNKEERNFIYTQLSGRKDFFKEEVKAAANKDNFERIKVCIDTIEMINSIQKRMLDR